MAKKRLLSPHGAKEVMSLILFFHMLVCIPFGGIPHILLAV